MKLRGLSQKVFLDRYSLKDKKGNPVEKTPDKMIKRVSCAVADVETTETNKKKWEKEFYQAMTGFKYVPGGRILAGAGTGFEVTYYNCLPPDQEILTPDGYKPISKVKVGDKVITGKKRERKVKHVFTREAKEPLYVIKSTKVNFDAARVTGEHPIHAIRNEWVNKHRSRDGLRLKNKPDWIKAKELKVGDFVAVAWNSQIRELSKINVKDYLPETFTTQDGLITKQHLKKPIKDTVEIDEQFMLLAGTWLGDGCVTHRTGTDIPSGIQITFNKEQKEWADDMAFILQQKFQVTPTVREDRWGQQLIQVRVESYPVGMFFKNLFGAYSYKKKIPQILMEQPKERILPLIKGMFRADGYLTDDQLGIALSNKQLATQLHQLILRTGRFFSIFENNAKNGRHDTYRISGGISQANGLCEYIFGEKRENTYHDQDYFLTHDDLFWVRIKSIETTPYKGKVYDLEVEEDHSFITGGIVVSNCFVIPSPTDSRDGILETLKQMVEIMARGGGVGINLSSLRPRGHRVEKVNGFSSGPCNWAELFSVATKDIIQQGGSRRGALMLMLWDWHPDVEEFITVKQDLTRINGANLSVCVSDSFMEAVEKDGDWDLIFPDRKDPEYDEKWDGDIYAWKAMGKKVIVHKTIKARAMWDLVASAAWRSAEPGVVFMERYNKMNNNWYWSRINCVNPCVTGDTDITVENGQKKARDLKVGDRILTPKGFKPIDKVYNNGIQRIYKVAFSDGGELNATGDHKLRTLRNGTYEWIKVTDLKKGDKITKLSPVYEHVSAPNFAFANTDRSLSMPVATSRSSGSTSSQPKLKSCLAEIMEVKDTGRDEEVYDVHEPETLTWITNGYVSLDCGEEGLPAWGVCNLGSINLSALVKGNNIDKKGTFDFRALRRITRAAVRFQDNVIEMDPYVFPGIRKTQYEGERRIGLGTMGLGDTLIKLHMRYGSAESLKFIDKVYRIIRDEAYAASVDIAREKGSFGKFDVKLYPQGKFIQQLPDQIQAGIKKGIRNSILLMQAPTGSTSLLVNTTSGIEPVYEYEFIRRDRIGEHVVRHHLYEKWYEKHGLDFETKKIEKPAWFVSANDLTPEDHVQVQAIIQKYVDASISKTVNAPKTHTPEDVKRLYTLAYKLGCKGIAYMREGSRAGVLERVDDKKTVPAGRQEEEALSPDIKVPPVTKRPPVMYGLTYKTQTPLGDAFITINKDGQGNPFEAFITIGKSGSDVSAMADALGRMISLALRLQSPVPERERVRQIVAQLSGIGGMRTIGFGEKRVRSVPDAVAKVLAEEFGFSVNGEVRDLREQVNGQAATSPAPIGVNGNGQPLAGPLFTGGGVSNSNGTPVPPFRYDSPRSNSGQVGQAVVMEQLSISTEPATHNAFDFCPSCGAATLAHEEGCSKCYSCGYSEC